MTTLEAIEERHAVRQYEDTPIPAQLVFELQDEIGRCNEDSGLHIQLITQEPEAFGGAMSTHYGKFSGVRNYIALIGKKGPDLDEKIGYYGEQCVLKAQMLGLNTCWVALTFSKRAAKRYVKIGPNEKLLLAVALGYGATQGVPHKSKTPEEVGYADGDPDWYLEGIRAALLAPTAMGQQKFRFQYEDSKVSCKAGSGFYTKVDLGIARYHFEQGAGRTDIWA